MRKLKAKFYFPALIWAILIFIVSAIPYLSAPAVHFTFWDKLAHITEYFFLGALTAMGLFRDSRKAPFLKALIIGTLFGLFDEIHQHFVPGRTMDIYDLLADSIGSAIGAGFFLQLKYRFDRRPKSGLPHGPAK
jgi:VanZ family protein